MAPRGRRRRRRAGAARRGRRGPRGARDAGAPRAGAWRSSRRRSASPWSSAIPTTTRTSSSRSRAAPAARRPGCGPATSTACSPSTPSAAASRSSRSRSATASTRSRSRATAPTRSSSTRAARTACSACPATESQGRIHTSTATVAVLPEAEDVDVQIDPNDLQIDVYRSSGPGGQSVNTTDSAVRITHKPTRHRRLDAGREEPAAEPREGDARAARAPVRAARWPSSRPSSPPTAARRSAPATAPRRSAPTTTASAASPTTASSSPSHNLDAVLEGELDEFTAGAQDDEKRRRLEAQAAATHGRRCAARRCARRSTRRSIALGAAGVDTPRLDAEVLLAHALGVDRAALLVDRDAPRARARRVRALPGRRAPALGRARAGRLHHRASRAFATSTSHVDPRVLIPRPETETLVEAALELPRGARVVDVGTGSGAVALALKDERPDLAVTATDVSDGRARRSRAPTRARLGLDVALRARPTCSTARARSTPSSPTRPTSRTARALAPEIARHEPRRGAVRRARRAGGRPPAGGAGRRARRRVPRARGRRRPGARRRGARARGGLRAHRAPRATSPGIERVVVGVALIAPPTPQTFERCIAVGGVAVFPADTVYGLACEPDTKEAVQRLYMLKRRRPDKPAAVMFFALELALAALPELGPRTRARAARAAARRRDAAAAQPGAAASRWPARPDPTTLGLRVPAWPPALAALADVRWPVLQSSANAAGGPDARRARGRARVHARARRPRPRRRRAARHAVDGGRPARLRGSTATWSVAREGAMSVTEVARAARVRAVTTPPSSPAARASSVARSSGGSWPTAGPCARSPAATRRPTPSRERGAEPVRGDLDDTGVDGRRRRRLRGRLPLRRPPRRLGRARGLRARQRAGHAQRTGRRAARPGVRRFVHVGTEAALLAGEPLVEVDERAPLRFDSPALYSVDQGAGRGGGARGQRRRPRDGRRAPALRLGPRRHDAAAGDDRDGPRRALRVDRRRAPPHVDDPRRQRRRGAGAGRRARRARRRLLRHRRRAGRLPRLRHRACSPPRA